MTPLELRARRLALGLGQLDLAHVLGVSDRTVRHWESGRHSVSEGVARDVLALVQVQDGAVDALVGRLAGDPTPTILVPVDLGGVVLPSGREPVLPLGWHLVCAARVVERLGTGRITRPA